MGAIIIFITFWVMEFNAWWLHKYLMHGALWGLHEDHHKPYHSVLQKNDAFFLVFAVPSWLLIMLGMMYSSSVSVYIGYGISIYGIAYFLIHEVLIHQRFKWFKKTNNFYFKAIRKAHKIHHKKQGKGGGECFGMLVVPWRFYKQAWAK